MQGPPGDAQQADLRFKTATEQGAPSRSKGALPPTQAPILKKLGTDGKLDRMDNLQGRTDIIHDHIKELFTDPLDWETPKWIWQRWPREVSQSLPRIDSQTVREVTCAFCQLTTCAEDHLVIDMFQELNEDIWGTLAKCFQLNHWTEDADAMWSTQFVTLGEQKNGSLTMRCFHPIGVLPKIHRFH